MTILQKQEGTLVKPENIDVPASRMVADLHDPARCRAASALLARVGDKWSVLVVMTLGGGTLRFNELRRRIGSISQRMLTITLRGLERDGLVTRTVFPTVPMRVDYTLTDLGRSLSKPVDALGTWAFDNHDAIEASRAEFDQKLQDSKTASANL